ncbi:unnamed protein product [Urochloa humidicola]
MESSSSSSGDTNPFAVGSVAISAATAQLINIKSHVPVTLDLGDSTFGTWRTFFNIAFRKFGLVDHVDGSTDARLMIHDAEWTQIDTCIVSWLYATLSTDLLTAVLQPEDDAYTAWNAICNQFLDNAIQRTALVRQAFHALHQADMSVTKYCGQIKTMANKLRDVGSPLLDQELVIALLSGLNDKFAHCISTISAARPPMKFLQAQSFLLQEEAWIANRAQKVASTALLAATRSAGVSSNAPAARSTVPASSPSGSSASSSSGGNDRPNKRKKHSGRSGPSGAPSSGAPVASWVHPWTGVVQAWPIAQLPNNQATVGVLGSRPGAAPQQSLTAQHAPSGALPPALYQALTGLSLQPNPPSASDWIFDTSASTHMAGNSGMLSSTAPSSSRIIVGNGASLPV